MSWVAVGVAGGSAVLGYMGQQSANKSAERVANTPQTTANSNQSQSSFTPNSMASPMYSYLGGMGQQMGQTPQPYFPGQGYIGPSAPTHAGVGMGMQSLPYYAQGAQLSPLVAQGYGMAAMQGLGAGGSMGGLLGMSNRNYGQLTNAADVANNPWVQNQISANERSVNKNLLEKVIPQISGGSMRAGMLGSSADALMKGQAVGDAAGNLANTNASTLLNAYGQGLGAQQNALGYTGAMLQNQLAPANATAWAAQQGGNAMNAYGLGAGMYGQGAQAALGYGQHVEDYQLRALQDAMSRYDYQYQEPWNRANSVSGILGQLQPLGVQNSNSAGTGSASGPAAAYTNPMLAAGQGALGGGMLAYGMQKEGMFGSKPATGAAPITNNNMASLAAGSLSRQTYGLPAQPGPFGY